jgi:hypothetical protein
MLSGLSGRSGQTRVTILSFRKARPQGLPADPTRFKINDVGDEVLGSFTSLFALPMACGNS